MFRALVRAVCAIVSAVVRTVAPRSQQHTDPVERRCPMRPHVFGADQTFQPHQIAACPRRGLTGEHHGHSRDRIVWHCGDGKR